MLNIEASEILDEHDLNSSLNWSFVGDKEANVTKTSIEEVRSEYSQELLEAINEAYYHYDNLDRLGIITIPDLNGRPIKEMIYRVLSELEITISKNIKSEYSDSRQLFKPARPETIGRWEKDQIESLGLHIAEYMN